MTDLPFDTIAIDAEGGSKRLTPDEFINLPIDYRVALLLQKRLRFLRHGESVEQRHALAALRKKCA